MARLSCYCAPLITGPGAEHATYPTPSVHAQVVQIAPSFSNLNSARFSFGLNYVSGRVKPRIRDTYASDRRLAGARLGIDLRGGRGNFAGVGLLPVQTYGG